MNIPRPEYPRPQMVRDSYINLNGKWQFEMDFGKTGKDRSFFKRKELDSEIIVPFCPESKLSGIGYTDFMECVWYKKDIDIPREWTIAGRKTILLFGACDYQTEVWIN